MIIGTKKRRGDIRAATRLPQQTSTALLKDNKIGSKNKFDQFLRGLSGIFFPRQLRGHENTEISHRLVFFIKV
jgi:hypothetical protein